ncbi:MAG TPA: beta family protein [Catenuloplanes sp.]|jgi:hypothetical protein
MDRVYRPVLWACRGELTALHHLDPAITPNVVPLLQILPSARGPTRDIADALRLVREHTPSGLTLGIDLSCLPDTDDSLRSPPLDIAEDLAERGIGLQPVIRAFDSDRRLIEHGLAARIHGRHAVVRFQRRVDVPEPEVATLACERIWRGTGLEPEQCHLVVDLAGIGCGAHAAHIVDGADRLLGWARRHPWRSVTLTAGSMPADLTESPTDEPVRLGRFDALLWRRLAAPDIEYGDYGVSCPSTSNGGHHRQRPTLRYTTEGAWWIYRSTRRGSRDDDRFADLCRTLVTSAHWPVAGARFSWGDAEIARRARCTPGAGTPSSWIAWATSHHLAQVVQELTGRHRASPLPAVPRPRRPGGWRVG